MALGSILTIGKIAAPIIKSLLKLESSGNGIVVTTTNRTDKRIVLLDNFPFFPTWIAGQSWGLKSQPGEPAASFIEPAIVNGMEKDDLQDTADVMSSYARLLDACIGMVAYAAEDDSFAVVFAWWTPISSNPDNPGVHTYCTEDVDSLKNQSKDDLWKFFNAHFPSGSYAPEWGTSQTASAGKYKIQASIGKRDNFAVLDVDIRLISKSSPKPRPVQTKHDIS